MPFEGNVVERGLILLLEAPPESQPLTYEQRQELLRKLRRLEELEEENRQLLNKLGELADEQAELGRLPNTPQAKLQWMLGERELKK